jgi:Na+/melibiose symporter-like transporter
MYVLNRPDLIAVLFTILSACMAVTSLLPPLLEKFPERRTILKIGLSITGLAFIAMYLTPATNVTMLIVCAIIGSLPLGFNGIMIFSMTADCIDDNELKTGVRSDGAIYSFTSLITKISNAIIGSLSLAALGFFGYVANAKQTPEAIDGINIVVNLAPGILFLLATIPMYFYGITKAKAKALNTSKELEAKRG